jgi:hypothetical protein
MRRSVLPALLAVSLAGCLVDFPPLPTDGKAPTESGPDLPRSDLDQAVPDGPRPEATAPDAPGPDVKPPADTEPPPETQAACLTSWSSWSCSTNPSNCVATCGSYLLVCNTNQCTCNNGGPNKTCGKSSSTSCSGCQSKLNDGCCQGL